MVNSELLKGSMTTLVLKVLSDRKMYGYEIMKDLEKLSKGSIEVKEGTLYPILHSLETNGSVSAEWSEETNGRRRKYYKITKKGKNLLQDKIDQWILFQKSVGQILAARLTSVEML